MRPVFKILLILLVIVAAAVLYVIGSTYYFFATKQSDRDVTTGLNVSTDWVEVTPQPPLKATKQEQYLIILVEGGHGSPETTGNQLPLPDGTVANPEVLIVDERGTEYRLHPSLILSSGVGYTGHYGERSSLPQDTSYTKVRIRCDKAFRASRIIWENLNLK